MLLRLNKPQLLPKSFILNKVTSSPFAKDYMFYLFQSVKTDLLSHQFFLNVGRVKKMETINKSKNEWLYIIWFLDILIVCVVWSNI